LSLVFVKHLCVYWSIPFACTEQVKEKELKTLNQTQSQMIWLMKQVITVQNDKKAHAVNRLCLNSSNQTV
jgi:hypothetical protein